MRSVLFIIPVGFFHLPPFGLARIRITITRIFTWELAHSAFLLPTR